MVCSSWHLLAERLHRADDRLRLHHHPGHATELHVIDLAVLARSVVAQVVDMKLDAARVQRAPDNADRERSREDVGKMVSTSKRISRRPRPRRDQDEPAVDVDGADPSRTSG